MSQSSGLLSSGGETTVLSVLVNRVTDPVDAGVLTDGSVERIDKDDFVILVGRVLVSPVRVQDTKTTEGTSSSFLSDASDASLVLELVDTMSLGLSVDDTLGDLSLSASTSNLDSVDDVTLLGLVSQAAGLVRAGGLGAPYEGRELSLSCQSKLEVTNRTCIPSNEHATRSEGNQIAFSSKVLPNTCKHLSKCKYKPLQASKDTHPF